MSESQTTVVADERDMTTTRALLAIDRCDRCGGQAYLRVVLKSGSELLFCAHHGKEHESKLREVADFIDDQRYRLENAERQPRDAGSTI